MIYYYNFDVEIVIMKVIREIQLILSYKLMKKYKIKYQNNDLIEEMYIETTNLSNENG